jgi:hypothetical protein
VAAAKSSSAVLYAIPPPGRQPAKRGIGLLGRLFGQPGGQQRRAAVDGEIGKGLAQRVVAVPCFVKIGKRLEHAARSRRRRPPLTRSVAWLARALQADARGNARATIAACTRGLDALDEHQMTLGATELRAYGTAHGAELARLAQREALRRGDVRRLLFWSERWRATAMAARSTPLQEDKELAAELEALRNVTRLLETPEMATSRRNALERDRRVRA